MAAKTKIERGERYAGRRADAAVISLTVDREAATILRQCGSRRKLGALVSRLVFEHQARQQERARLKQKVLVTLDRED